MKVLVVGGAGYIGSHVCKALAGAGHEPIVYDNLTFGHLSAVKWGPFELGDILDRERLVSVIKRYAPDGVMHFAAFAYVGESIVAPAKYYLNNVAGSLTLLEAMRETGLCSIVFSSTCATYGIPDRLPISEDTPQAPINPYGQTKLCIERALSDYADAYGLRWTALRYFNAAGCDPEGELGERHDPETHLVPLAIRAALERTTLTVYGDDYDTADGSAIRDFVHVSDIAAAHVLALRHLQANGQSGAFNLGVGRGVSVFEIVRSVEAIAGYKIKLRIDRRRPGDPPELFSEAIKARDVLKWYPRYPAIDDIVLSAFKWFASAPINQPAITNVNNQ